MIEININPDVLVIGGGVAGILATQKIRKQGYSVSILDQGQGFEPDPCYKMESASYYSNTIQELKKDPKVSWLEDGQITKVDGMLGDFKVYVKSNGKVERKNFGAIVVATPFDCIPVFEEYGLTPGENVFSVNHLLELLSENKPPTGIAVFLTTFQEETNPVSFKNIVLNAIEIGKLGSTVYVFVRNVKTAAPGLEKLILHAKNHGVMIIKSNKAPEVEIKDNRPIVTTYDPIIKKDIEIYADYVIIEDKIVPNEKNNEISELFGIHTDSNGFLQTNNVRRIPVFTNRKGIFVVGSAANIKPFPYILTDAIDVSCEIQGLLKGGGKVEVEETISIDQEKCVRCLTCYRVCPHGAIYWDVDRVAISSLVCEGCGICTAECPMNAIQINEYSDDKIKDELKDILKSKGDEPLFVAFCCKNSAFEAAKGAEKQGIDLPKGFKVIKVPCAGKVDVDYVLEALVKGVDGVIIGACYKDNCKSEKGNIFASYRIAHLKDILSQIGINPKRVELINVASNMPKEFGLKLQEVSKKIVGMGS